MRFVYEKEYVPAVSVHLEDVEENDKKKVVGMLRGLMCAIEGWHVIKDLTNDHFIDNDPVRLAFTSKENARYFKERAEYFFSGGVGLKIKRRVRKQ